MSVLVVDLCKRLLDLQERRGDLADLPDRGHRSHKLNTKKKKELKNYWSRTRKPGCLLQEEADEPRKRIKSLQIVLARKILLFF